MRDEFLKQGCRRFIAQVVFKNSLLSVSGGVARSSSVAEHLLDLVQVSAAGNVAASSTVATPLDKSVLETKHVLDGFQDKKLDRFTRKYFFYFFTKNQTLYVYLNLKTLVYWVKVQVVLIEKILTDE